MTKGAAKIWAEADGMHDGIGVEVFQGERAGAGYLRC